MSRAFFLCTIVVLSLPACTTTFDPCDIPGRCETLTGDAGQDAGDAQVADASAADTDTQVGDSGVSDALDAAVIDAGPCIDEEPCSRAGMDGVCIGDTCCTGCVADGACVLVGDSQDNLSCGRGGAACDLCGAAEPECRAGRCEAVVAVRDVVAGYRTTCAIGLDDSLYCWGSSPSVRGGATVHPACEDVDCDQCAMLLSVPSFDSKVGDVRATTLDVALSDLEYGSLLDESGRRTFWGYDINTSQSTCRPAPALDTNRYERLSLGGSSACAVSEGNLYCWGRDNLSGELGSPINPLEMPTLVTNTGDITHLSHHSDHTCVIRDGQVHCMGCNGQGQVGTATCDSPGPLECPLFCGSLQTVTVEGGFIDIRVGGSFSCALREGSPRTIHCWGEGAEGRLGTGNDSPQPTPSDPIGVGVAWDSLSVGVDHSCALTESGEAYCWGRNNLGQVGNGETGNFVTEPTPVLTDQTFAGISCGWQHTCAWTEGGAVFCWGFNGQGQGADAITPAPVIVGDGA